MFYTRFSKFVCRVLRIFYRFASDVFQKPRFLTGGFYVFFEFLGKSKVLSPVSTSFLDFAGSGFFLFFFLGGGESGILRAFFLKVYIYYSFCYTCFGVSFLKTKLLPKNPRKVTSIGRFGACGLHHWALGVWRH